MITIERVTLHHLEKITNLFNEYRVFYDQPSDTSAARAFLEARIQNSESVIFMAGLNGEAAGFTQLYPVFSSVGLQRAWILNDLYVTEAARKQGIAKRLLEAARQHGLATQSRYLVLQ